MVVNRSPDYIIQPNKPQEQKKEMLKIVKSRDATVTARQDIFTAALALRSRGLVIGSREKEREEKEEEKEREEEEKNLQIAIRCLWDLFD